MPSLTRRARLALCGVVLAAATTGCAAAGSSTAGTRPARPATTPQRPVDPTPYRIEATGDRLTGRLLSTLSDGRQTVALSPYSIAQALAMTYVGARDSTADQMARALGFGPSAGALASAFGRLDRSLAAASRGPTTLSVANALYGQRGQSFRPAFLSTLAGQFGAPLRTTDFASGPAAAIAEINGWVSGQTHGRIPKLLSSSDVDATTKLVLVNAIYLKALWSSPFTASDTAPAAFHAPSGTRRAPTMHQTSSFGYRRAAGYAVLELPYQGGRLALDLLLPDPGRMPALLERLRRSGVAATLGALRQTDVRLSLPKVALDTRVELKGALSRLGMPLAFSDNADLSGIAGPPGYLTIAAAVHQADVKIDEQGTEAAAATGVIVAPTAAPLQPPVSFDVNRPFVFVLRDLQTTAIAFAGVVADPAG